MKNWQHNPERPFFDIFRQSEQGGRVGGISKTKREEKKVAGEKIGTAAWWVAGKGSSVLPNVR